MPRTSGFSGFNPVLEEAMKLVMRMRGHIFSLVAMGIRKLVATLLMMPKQRALGT
jgi:hypothetical protein